MKVDAAAGIDSSASSDGPVVDTPTPAVGNSAGRSDNDLARSVTKLDYSAGCLVDNLAVRNNPFLHLQPQSPAAAGNTVEAAET